MDYQQENNDVIDFHHVTHLCAMFAAERCALMLLRHGVSFTERDTNGSSVAHALVWGAHNNMAARSGVEEAEEEAYCRWWRNVVLSHLSSEDMRKILLVEDMCDFRPLGTVCATKMFCYQSHSNL